jgi:hypothetical protein
MLPPQSLRCRLVAKDHLLEKFDRRLKEVCVERTEALPIRSIREI